MATRCLPPIAWGHESTWLSTGFHWCSTQELWLSIFPINNEEPRICDRVPNDVIHRGSFGCEILAYIGMSCFVSLYQPWAFGFANGWRFDEDWAHMVMLHDFAAFCSIFLLGMVRSVSPRRNGIQRTVQRRLGRSGWHRFEDEPYINGSRWILWVSDWGIFWLHTS